VTRGGAAIVLFAWAMLLAALAAMLWIWVSNALEVALLGGAAVASAVLGLYVRLDRRAKREAGALQPVPALSLPTVTVAIALSATAVGAAAGLWLVWFGLGMLCFGVAWLIRELVGAHRAGRS